MSILHLYRSIWIEYNIIFSGKYHTLTHQILHSRAIAQQEVKTETATVVILLFLFLFLRLILH